MAKRFYCKEYKSRILWDINNDWLPFIRLIERHVEREKYETDTSKENYFPGYVSFWEDASRIDIVGCEIGSIFLEKVLWHWLSSDLNERFLFKLAELVEMMRHCAKTLQPLMFDKEEEV